MSKLRGGIGKVPMLLSSFGFAKKKKQHFQRRLDWTLAGRVLLLLPVSWLRVVTSKCCTEAVAPLPSLCWLAPLPEVFCIQILLLCRSPKRCKGIQLQRACSLKICSNSCCSASYQLLWSSGGGREFSVSGRWIFCPGAKWEWAEKCWRGQVTSLLLLSFSASVLCVRAALCVCHRERFSFPWQLLYISLAFCFPDSSLAFG